MPIAPEPSIPLSPHCLGDATAAHPSRSPISTTLPKRWQSHGWATQALQQQLKCGQHPPQSPYGQNMATFAAIDFETAREDRNSACAVGLSIVDDNETTVEQSWLIHPPDNRYDDFNIAIHGIRPTDTAEALNFDQALRPISLTCANVRKPPLACSFG